MVTAFCHQLGWKNMEMLISQFQDRLHFGIHSELLELMRLPSLNGVRARSLFNAGFETVPSIATGDVNLIENALYLAIPFQSEKERDDDDIDDAKKRNKNRNIWVTGYSGLTLREAANNLILEARQHLRQEIGVDEIKWKNDFISIDGKIKADIKIKECIELDPVKGNENEISKLVPKNDCLDTSCNDLTKSQTKNVTIKPKHSIVSQKQKDAVRDMPSINISDNVNVNMTNVITSKEDIIWDSLDFTENALKNISKLKDPDVPSSGDTLDDFHNMDKMSMICENIEIVNNETSNCTSRDVSLFSSDDGDNSSLFEDSLPLHLLPSKLFDNNCTEYKKNISNNNNLTCMKSNVLSQIDTLQYALEEDSDDMKLFYDEDDNVDDSLENESILNTQENIISEHSHFEEPKFKKMKLEVIMPKAEKYLFQIPTMKCKRSRTFTMYVKKVNILCYELRENDVLDSLSMLANNVKSMSIFLINESSSLQTMIGSNILRKDKAISLPEQSYKNNILGLALFIDELLCVYLDLNCSEKTRILLHSKLKDFFLKIKSNIKLLSTKHISLNFMKLFRMNFQEFCTDISLAEWLIRSDEKEPSFNSLVILSNILLCMC